MPSFVWYRDPAEAHFNPYEYGAQEQFVEEAGELLSRWYQRLMDGASVPADDRTVEKAVWLLHVDAIDACRDALDLLVLRRHRSAARCFRTVIEAVDFARWFASGTSAGASAMDRWYRDEYVKHFDYRMQVQREAGSEEAQWSRTRHQVLSKFVHRSYRVVLDGYMLGGDGLVHDGIGETLVEARGVDTGMVLPHTMASYLATTAFLIREVGQSLVERDLFEQAEADEDIVSSLKAETPERRFSLDQWWRWSAIRQADGSGGS